MNKTWQLQEAKNKFSEVVQKALLEGPQEITRKGINTVVVISVKEYNKLKKHKSTLIDFFSNSPLYELNLKLDRDKDIGREVNI